MTTARRRVEAAIQPPDALAAADMLRAELGGACLRDLACRIVADPEGWINGRDNVRCGWCAGNGIRIIGGVPRGARARRVTCAWCGGRRTAAEGSLHIGFGTNVRNLLRCRGFTERDLRIGNLDDYYVGLLELAVERELCPR